MLRWVRLVLAVLVAAAPACLFAQVLPAPLIETPVAAALTEEEQVDQILAFINREDRMSVPVRVNGAGPYRFIIDTGSERTVISRQVAAALGLAAGRNVSIAAMTGVSSVGTAHIPSLEIDAMPRGLAIEAPTLEDAHLGADGLVGLDSLEGNAVLIDFEASEMRVNRSLKRRSRGAAPGEIIVRAKSLAGRLIVTDARYAGKRISVVLDTGTTVSVGNSALLALVQAKARQEQPVQMVSVTGGLLKADFRVVPKMTVGDIEFKSIAVAFSDVAPFKRLGLQHKPALFLGMDAMRLFRQVKIDFPNREVRFLLPRETFIAGRLTGTRMP